MFIQNFNLRKRLGMNRLMEADGGAGGTGDNTGTGEEASEGQEGTGEGGESEEKTFTQADVDKLIKERIAREKKNQLPKEELKAYQEWKESQKTEAEKQSEALTNAEKAKLEAEERANSLEAKVTCLTKGVNANSVDDVVILAKAMVTDEVTIEQAIDKVLEKYPSFKGEQQQETKGFIIGGKGGKEKANQNDQLKAIFGIK